MNSINWETTNLDCAEILAACISCVPVNARLDQAIVAHRTAFKAFDGAPGEHFAVYLRTVGGRRVISFEVSGDGEDTAQHIAQLSVTELGKLQPLIGSAVVRAEDERRGPRW